jgi:hypothetical protein
MEAGEVMRSVRGQASVEMLGAVPVVLLLGLVFLQLLAVGYAAVLAGNAAESAALAVAGGGRAVEAARAAVPGWSRAHMRVAVTGGHVEVRMQPPAALGALARQLEVHAEATVERP